MPEPDWPNLSAADALFMDKCREDLDALFAPRDEVVAIMPRRVDEGSVELEARVVVSGRPGAFSAAGETIVEAYARLRSVAPEERIRLAFRVLVDEPLRR